MNVDKQGNTTTEKMKMVKKKTKSGKSNLFSTSKKSDILIWTSERKTFIQKK